MLADYLALEPPQSGVSAMTRPRGDSNASSKSDMTAKSSLSESDFMQVGDDGIPQVSGYQYGPYTFMAPGQSPPKHHSQSEQQPLLQDAARHRPQGHAQESDDIDQMPALPYLAGTPPPVPDPPIVFSGSSYPRMSLPGSTPSAPPQLKEDTALVTARPSQNSSPLTARGPWQRGDLERSYSSDSLVSSSQSHSAQHGGRSVTTSRQSTVRGKQQSRMNSQRSGVYTPIAAISGYVSGRTTPHSVRSFAGTAESGVTNVTQHPPLPANYSANVAVESHFLYDSKQAEEDDYMHDPAVKKRVTDGVCCAMGIKGFLNVFTLVLITAALLGLFCVYPVCQEIYQRILAYNGSFGYGGTNSTGQVPDIPNLPTLIDRHTPQKALTRTGFDGSKYNLVFSDEFEVPGRTFYEGDDPFWSAVDLHYWGTGNYEWYDPSAVTTANGSLVITISKQRSHDLDYMSGMIQSWNMMCFTGGYIEARVQLPGSHQTSGFWPGVWTMGNLGRAGFGATTDGVWPYSYDSCDVGTRPNQTNADESSPAAAVKLSYQPGQKLSACTCKGEDHPGPDIKTGRGSPEVDLIEAVIDSTGSVRKGGASQSFQLAPYDPEYHIDRSQCRIKDSSMTEYNTYEGGRYQQCASGLTYFPDNSGYESVDGYSTYGFELVPGTDPASRITWTYNGEETWTMMSGAIGPNPATQIQARIVPDEPLYMILNLGISDTFQTVDLTSMPFPAHMKVDYVRVYQQEGMTNIGCDPKDRPTSAYIDKHLNAYTNANLTTWKQAGYRYPKQRLVDGCKQ